MYEQEEIYSLKEELLSALYRRRDRSAFGILEVILEREQDVTLKGRAIAMTAGQPELLPLFIRLVQSPDSNINVRREAMRALGKAGGPEARRILETVAANTENVLVQRAAQAELQRLARQEQGAAAGP